MTTLAHGGPVRTVAFEPSADVLLTAGRGARVWDVASAQRLCQVDPGGTCVAACFAPDAERFALGTLEGNVTLYDTLTGVTRLELRPRRREISQIVFEPDRRQLAVAALDGRVVRYDFNGNAAGEHVVDTRPDPDLDFGVLDLASTPQGLLYTIEGAVGLIRPGGRVDRRDEERLYEPRIAAVRGDVALVRGSDLSLVLDLRTFDVTTRLPGGWACALSDDGRRVAIGGAAEAAIVDVATGARLALVGGHPTGVTAVAFAADGLYTGGEDGRVLAHTAHGALLGVVAQHPRQVAWLGANGHLSVGADGTIERRGGRTPQPVVWPTARRPDTSIDLAIGASAAHWLGGDELIVVAGDHTGRYDASSGACLARSATTGTAAVSTSGAVALSTDKGLTVLTGDRLVARRLWREWASPTVAFLGERWLLTGKSRRGLIVDARTGDELLHVGQGAPFLLAELPRQRALISLPQSSDGIVVVDYADVPRVERTLNGARPRVSPDGTRLIRHDGGPRLIDLDSYVELMQVADTAPHAFVASWSPDSAAVAHVAGGRLTLRDRDGAVIAEMAGETPRHLSTLAVSSTRRVAAGTSWSGGCIVWDPSANAVQRLDSGGDGITVASWACDDRLVVRLQRDNRDHAYLYDADGQLVAPLLGFRRAGQPRVVPVFPGVQVAGSLLLVAHRDDGIVRGFDRTDGGLVFEAAPTRGTLRDVRLDPTKTRLLAVDDAGEVRIYAVTS